MRLFLITSLLLLTGQAVAQPPADESDPLDELEKKLNAAPMGSRKDWCEQSPQRINAPEMNLLRRSVLVNAIESFAP